MKKIIWMLLVMLIVLAGGISMYVFLNPVQQADFRNEMFVDGRDGYGYAAMYDLPKTL